MQPNFSTMTLDELETWMVDCKAQETALLEQRRIAAGYRRDKIDAHNLATALKQDVSHLNAEEVQTLLEIARKPKPGDVVVEIGTAVLTAKGKGADVE